MDSPQSWPGTKSHGMDIAYGEAAVRGEEGQEEVLGISHIFPHRKEEKSAKEIRKRACELETNP